MRENCVESIFFEVMFELKLRTSVQVALSSTHCKHTDSNAIAENNLSFNLNYEKERSMVQLKFKGQPMISVQPTRAEHTQSYAARSHVHATSGSEKQSTRGELASENPFYYFGRDCATELPIR